jgi:hypothetical protein
MRPPKSLYRVSRCLRAPAPGRRARARLIHRPFLFLHSTFCVSFALVPYHKDHLVQKLLLLYMEIIEKTDSTGRGPTLTRRSPRTPAACRRRTAVCFP